MKKKIIVIFVMTLLIATAYGSIGLKENTISNSKNSVEVEDQHNLYDSENFNDLRIDDEDKAFAQSFIPACTPLTKVRLHVWTYGLPPAHTNYTVSIRENLDGEDIVSTTINSDDFGSGKIDFIFPDTDLTIGILYYIVLTADKIGSLHNWYLWKSSYNTYENGDVWVFRDLQWQIADIDSERLDMGFTTYWRDYPPNDPEIDGPIKAKPGESIDYTFHTIDPEGHDVRYYIEWGDGNTSKWFGQHESGEYAVKSHKWASEGNYTIRAKAKDIYDAESDWTTLEVSMPKSKIILIINQGGFTAEIGVGEEKEPRVYLNGNYRARGRFTVAYGTATNGEKEVRFQGLFKGSYFILQIPLRGRSVNIIGRYTMEENREFSGRWTIRSTELNGWIEGTIS